MKLCLYSISAIITAFMSYKFLKTVNLLTYDFPKSNICTPVLTWQIADTRCVHSADVAVKVQVKVIHIFKILLAVLKSNMKIYNCAFLDIYTRCAMID